MSRHIPFAHFDELFPKEFHKQVFRLDSYLLGEFFNLGVSDEHHFFAFAVDFCDKLVGKFLFGIVNDIVKREFFVGNTFSKFIYGETKSTPHFLQLADFRTATTEFRYREYIRIIPALLECPLGKNESSQVIH